MKRLFKLLLFWCSYTPLFIIFIIRDLKIQTNSGNWHIACNNTLFVIGVIAVMIILNIKLAFVFRINKNKPAAVTKIVRVYPRNSDLVTYIVVYILPFVSFSSNSITDVASMLFMLLVGTAIYIRMNFVFINPILNIFGYNAYEAETSAGQVVMIITKRNNFRGGDGLKLIELGDLIYWEA